MAKSPAENDLSLSTRTALRPRYSVRFLSAKTVQPDFYKSLNRRIGIIINSLLVVYPFVFLGVFISGGMSLNFAGIHLLSYVMVIGFRYLVREHDSVVVFFVTHIFWFYTFAIFIYALLHLKSPDADLYAPILSSTISAVALAASICGYGLGIAAQRFLGMPRWRSIASNSENAFNGFGLILVATPFVMLPLIDRENSLLSAASGIFAPILWLGVITYCTGRGTAAAKSLLIPAVVVVILATSILLNARGLFLSLVVTIVMVYLGIARHAVKPVRLLALYLGNNAVNALSYLMLNARLIAGHEGSGAIVLGSLFSFDFVLAVFGFDTSGSAVRVNDQLVRHDQYLLRIFDGRLGLLERLTQLPHMDIVAARLPYPVPINWGEINNAILSSLPSFGQSKDLIFNDRLAWGTGLIVRDNISHPLVTAAGEFYAMGGFISLFIFFVVLVGLTVYMYKISQRVIGDRFIAAAALLPFTLYLVFSSTSVSALAVPFRIFPSVLILYPIFGRLVWRLIPSHRRGASVVPSAAAILK